MLKSVMMIQSIAGITVVGDDEAANLTAEYWE